MTSEKANNNRKILIVEDEPVIAFDLKYVLEDAGYRVIGIAHNIQEALAVLQTHRPHMVLLDIYLKNPTDGIELAKIIDEKYNVPFIYTTSYSDRETLNTVKATHPYGYVVKPFHEETLLATIEVAISNFEQIHAQANGNTLVRNNALMVKQGHGYRKVPLEDILWMTAKGNYTQIVTTSGKLMPRTGINKLKKNLPSPPFIQIHRSYVVNSNHISRYQKGVVLIDGVELPVGKTHRPKLFELLQ